MSEQAQNLNEELVEEVQQETTSTEDPLEEAIARVQELEEQLKAQVEETSKKEQDLLPVSYTHLTLPTILRV